MNRPEYISEEDWDQIQEEVLDWLIVYINEQRVKSLLTIVNTSSREQIYNDLMNNGHLNEFVEYINALVDLNEL